MAKLPELRFEKSLLKLAGLVVLAGGFVALGIWMLTGDFSDSRHAPIVFKTVGWTSLIFFGACGLVGIAQLFDRRPAVILDADGLTYTYGFRRSQRLEWKDIEQPRIVFYNSQRFVAMTPFDIERYMASLAAPSRKLAKLNMKMTGAPFHMSANNIKGNVNGLFEACLEYWSATGRD